MVQISMKTEKKNSETGKDKKKKDKDNEIPIRLLLERKKDPRGMYGNKSWK